ncbi:MAG: hypothetical protein EOR77_21515 [Mesorhizobium sp.]|uniref:hypothetical protein n=1 Tax=Mesorhizobium sp. TaxID=1871066 RepID=UPI000FE7D35A|nr:hypothetical protein [Mesorhizobium sp.]RWM32611.1 MAG: hypothetical protein EOR77_21515 [Mesorhizobium sp.]
MNRDRVRFTLPNDGANTARAAQRAFGLTCSQAYHAVHVKQTIICRPSQFARFLIYRGFNQFNAELLPAEHHDHTLDVTRNQ